jgi:plastocyanin
MAWSALAVALAMAAPALAYEVAPVIDGGTLTGTLKLVGPAPKVAPLTVTRQRDVCGERKASEALVVGLAGSVQGGVVLLEGVAKGKKPSGEVTLDNTGCLFVSHVTAVTAGERVRVKNSDPVLHSTHFVARPGGFNLALPGKEQTIDITKRLTTPGVLRVLCDAHPHMAAWMVVHDSPYLAVTDERGAFRIDAIPPGTYKVTLWHEGFRASGVDRDGRPRFEPPHRITKQITIAPKGSVALNFELK